MNENMNMNKFEIEVCSDSNYKELVTILSVDSDEFAVLSCDDGLSQTKIKIYSKLNGKLIWEFNYHEFIKALTRAYEKLKEANQHVITE